VRPQRKTAVGAVRPLFDKPAVDACETTEFRTVGTESGIPQLVHTDETPENISDTLRESASTFICLVLLSSISVSMLNVKV